MLPIHPVLLFNADSYNSLFVILGLLLGAAAAELGYRAVRILNGSSPGKSTNSRITDIVAGAVLLGVALFLLLLAGLCAMWVIG